MYDIEKEIAKLGVNVLAELITKKLSVLVGLPFRCIGRTADMLWVEFGEDVICEDCKGDKRILHKYGVHITGTFRFQSNERILFGSYDIVEPNSTTEWTEEFDWNKIGTTYFDECADLLTKEIEKEIITVVCINASPYGDLQISLSNGLVINAFIDNGSDEECWRFFTNENGEHFIVTGRGIETVSKE